MSKGIEMEANKKTENKQPTQEELNEAYKNMMFWLLRIRVQALKALERGEKDV